MSDPSARAGGILTIDLDAIAANWRKLAEMAYPHARAAAVVKADGYGLGAVPVAWTLAAAGCSWFFVATLDEGMGLRAALPKARIFILDGLFPGTAADFVAHDLVPVLNSPAQVEEWIAFARRAGRTAPAAIHVDTGLVRLGMPEGYAIALAGDAVRRGALDLCLVMSHLACSDQPAHPLNREQRDRFAAMCRRFPGVPSSLAASFGLFLGRGWHADWVRPGAALFGVNPTAPNPNPMAQVVHLQGRIIQVRAVDAGEAVGYGASWRSAGKTKIAVVAAGYGDGLPRALGNRGSAMVGEHRVPLVGRVSMDLVEFDVGAVPEGLTRPGMLVDLIGPNIPVDEVAEAAGTIGYEILTNLGRRYHRIYAGGVGA